ncbi:hypothetical protein DTO96_100521 [Ephemeroptericola cinctiostellae]|uniref:Uncharacterized protein n=1 Tax=Ephemeroptericola cinctiostellae TaxID=2268024 RepID=A0A345D8X3_9BURK|nr:hypothetical protein DTO96_100521 [Ephemeroptericola cinctiostellae]
MRMPKCCCLICHESESKRVRASEWKIEWVWAGQLSIVKGVRIAWSIAFGLMVMLQPLVVCPVGCWSTRLKNKCP